MPIFKEIKTKRQFSGREKDIVGVWSASHISLWTYNVNMLHANLPLGNPSPRV